MKKYFDFHAGEYTPAQVRTAAWRLYAAQVFAPYRRGILPPMIDRRYKFNREAIAEFERILKSHDLQADRARYIARHHSGIRFAVVKNILAAPLVRDYYENRHNVRRVCSDHIEFNGRNHWAKNDRDRRILAILAKNFTRWQQANR